jgi:hypothetical protein
MTYPPEDEDYLAVRARKVGCEAIYLRTEADDLGRWHFNQNYDKGIPYPRTFTTRHPLEAVKIAMDSLSVRNQATGNCKEKFQSDGEKCRAISKAISSWRADTE